MNQGSLKESVKRWAAQIGKKKAVRRLTDPMGPDLSFSVAEKLVSGRYGSEVGFEKGQKILREMAKDGVTLASDKAS